MMMKYMHHLSSIPARVKYRASGKLLYGRRELSCVLCDSLEEWDEGEVQEGRAIPVLRADVCYCIAGTKAILESNYLPIKKKKRPTQYWKAIIFQLKINLKKKLNRI